MKKTKTLFIFFMLFQILCPSFQILCPPRSSISKIIASEKTNSETGFYLSPKDVYVGDLASLNYEFYASFDLNDLCGSDTINFNSPDFPAFFAFNSKVYDIEISKEKNIDSLYTLKIHFSAFETGLIEVEDFDLRSFLANELKIKEESFGKNPILIQIPAFEIKSILSLYPDTPIRPMKGILLLPGTSYFVYFFLCFIILFIIMFFYITHSAKKRSFSFFGFLKFFLLKLSIIHLKKKIHRLLKKSLSLRDFSYYLQVLLCKYLKNRFGKDFSSYTNTEIVRYIYLLYEDLLDDESESLLFDLETIFVRLNYLRFSENTAELDAESEKKALASQVLAFISGMEKKHV